MLTGACHLKKQMPFHTHARNYSTLELGKASYGQPEPSLYKDNRSLWGKCVLFLVATEILWHIEDTFFNFNDYFEHQNVK